MAIAGAIVFYLLTMRRRCRLPSSPRIPRRCQWRVHLHGRRLRGVPREPLAKCKDTKVKDKTRLAGGRCLKTPFGVFNVPNISPDKETGIGNWSTLDFVNAMKRGNRTWRGTPLSGVSLHSYQRMTYEDLIDLKAYLDTLPAVKHKTPPHELTFPYNIRRGSAFGSCFMWTERPSRLIPRRVTSSIAGRISSRARPLRGVSFDAEFSRGHHSEPGLCRRPQPRRQGQDSEHHAEPRRSWRVECRRHHLSARDRQYAGLRRDRRRHGAGAGEYGEAQAEDRSAIAAYLKSLPPLPDAVPKRKKANGEDEEEKEGDGSGGETSDGGSKQPDGAEQ